MHFKKAVKNILERKSQADFYNSFLWSKYKNITENSLQITKILDKYLWKFDNRFKNLQWNFLFLVTCLIITQYRAFSKTSHNKN